MTKTRAPVQQLLHFCTQKPRFRNTVTGRHRHEKYVIQKKQGTLFHIHVCHEHTVSPHGRLHNIMGTHTPPLKRQGTFDA